MSTTENEITLPAHTHTHAHSVRRPNLKIKCSIIWQTFPVCWNFHFSISPHFSINFPLSPFLFRPNYFPRRSTWNVNFLLCVADCSRERDLVFFPKGVGSPPTGNTAISGGSWAICFILFQFSLRRVVDCKKKWWVCFSNLQPGEKNIAPSFSAKVVCFPTPFPHVVFEMNISFALFFNVHLSCFDWVSSIKKSTSVGRSERRPLNVFHFISSRGKKT